MKCLLPLMALLPLSLSNCSCPTDFRDVPPPQIQHEADVAALTNCQIEHYGTTLLADATSPEIVRALLEAGANPNGKLIRKGMSHNGTALLKATHPEIVSELLSAGAAVDMPSGEHSHTPLCSAACDGANEKVRLLLAGGADPDLMDSRGIPPLCLAAENMNAQACKLLLDKGAQPDSLRSEDGASALLCALKAGNSLSEQAREIDQVARVLLAAGATPGLPDTDGCTPLHLAPIDLVPMLIACGSNVNARDSRGRTPLFYSTSPQHAEALLNAGAELNALDNFGNTPFDLVQNAQVKSYLLIRGAASGHAL